MATGGGTMSKDKRKKSAMWGRSLLVGSALVLAAVACLGQDGTKLSSELQNLRPSDKVDLIVQFRQAPAAADHKRVLRYGGALRHEFRELGVGAYKDVP